VEGILVNAQTDRKVNTVLTSLIAALVAFGGNSASEDAGRSYHCADRGNLLMYCG